MIRWAKEIRDGPLEKKRPADKGGVKTLKLQRRGEINFAPHSSIDLEQTSSSKQILLDEVL